jgi:tRNA-dihydrouridine synthase
MLDETGCDGVMVGRAAVSNPWLIQQCAAHLAGRTPPEPDLAAKRALVTRHIELLADAYDEQALVHKLKVFTRSFSHGLPGGRALRQELSSLHRSADLVAAVERFLA